MKIALIRRGWSSSGGAEAYLCRLAAGLQNAGHLPVLVGSPDWPSDAWVNSEIRRVSRTSPIEFARAARAAADGCDLVFSMERIGRCDIYRAGDGVHAAWQARRAAFEPSWKRWTRVFNRKQADLLALEARTFSPDGARFVIANSKLVENEILSRFDYPPDRIQVIANGIPPVTICDDPGARAALRETLGVRTGETLILFAGSGWDRKGLRFAVEAVRGVAGGKLVVAGRGIWRRTVPESVSFLGPVRDMDALYAAADVFVLPTIYDPFSNACLEALGHGLPVVTTDANGVSEILSAGVHGSIVPVGDVSGLRSALELWSDPMVREPAGDACRQLAAKYSMDENVRQTLDVISRARAR